MRKLSVIFLLLIPFLSYGQSDGYYEIPKRFYSRIDSLKKLGCCDTGFCALSLSYNIPLFQYPIFDKLDIEDYEQKVMDEGYVENVVQDLVNAYYKIKPSYRNKITKSSFKIKENYKIEYDKTGAGIYWVEGTLNVTFNFQSNQRDFGIPWYKKWFYKVKI